MDDQKVDGEWSVEKVLQVIIINCRSWRGDGMKVWYWRFSWWLLSVYLLSFSLFVLFSFPPFWQMFTQLRFTYEQESHPEEFFTPYVWQLVVSRRYSSSCRIVLCNVIIIVFLFCFISRLFPSKIITVIFRFNLFMLVSNRMLSAYIIETLYLLNLYFQLDILYQSNRRLYDLSAAISALIPVA